MEFEWDENKRQSVIRERGVDILDAALIFEGYVLTRRDERDYGEARFISLGMADTQCYVVVHTERNGVIRLITAWKGGQDEREAYEESLADRDPENEGSR